VSWSASLSGEFHEIVKAVRNLEVTGNDRAIELGHVEVAKEMALCAIDKERKPNVKFFVTISGHVASERVYNVAVNVSVAEKAAK
jgi:hypothetical protein